MEMPALIRFSSILCHRIGAGARGGEEGEDEGGAPVLLSGVRERVAITAMAAVYQVGAGWHRMGILCAREGECRHRTRGVIL